MFTLQLFTSILAFLSFSVRAFPLSQRDVLRPPIIKPDASSVWPIGTQQIVIWNSSGTLQSTDPLGQVVLHTNEVADFNATLAENFELTDGNVTITVPNVTPGASYYIVLFGDSGDLSPNFTISSPGTSSSSASSGSIPGATPPATATSTDNTSAAVNASTIPPQAPTETTTTGTINISNSASAVTSALATPSSTSAGWSLHRGSSLWSSAAPFLMSVTPFVVPVVFMV